MRSNLELCDVEFVVDGAQIPAHRVVLAASSPYFNAMFNSDLSERNQCQIELHDVTADAVSLLVDYIYTGDLTISDDNVQALLSGSCLLQMNDVRDACCSFLLRQLHPSNCLGIRNFADTHSCEALQTLSHKYALDNFESVCCTDEFLHLPFKQVRELVSNNEMSVTSEETVYRAIVSWIKHDEPSRNKHTAELLSFIKLPLMSRHFLVDCVDTEPLVVQNSQCRELLLEALKFHLMPERRNSLASSRTKSRISENAAPYMFAIGGGSLFAVHSECEVYNPRLARWTALAPMTSRRSRAGVASDGHQLYVIGGYDGAADLCSAESYCPLKNRWCPITSMGSKRSCFGAVGLGGLIYCCGGYDGASCLSSVERYDPLAGCWTSLPQMSSKRRHCRLTALDQCIYAIGGFDSTSYLNTVERFDPREGRWNSLPAMSTRRSSGAVVAVGEYLYCVGGNDGSSCLTSSERFNIRGRAWENIAGMTTRRATHDVACLGGRLYVVGGNDGSSSLASVESYDEKLNKWQVEPSMNNRRSSVAVTVLNCSSLEKKLSLRHASAESISSSTERAKAVTSTSAPLSRIRSGADRPSSSAVEKHSRRDRRIDFFHRGTL